MWYFKKSLLDKWRKYSYYDSLSDPVIGIDERCIDCGIFKDNKEVIAKIFNLRSSDDVVSSVRRFLSIGFENRFLNGMEQEMTSQFTGIIEGERKLIVGDTLVVTLSILEQFLKE